MGRAFQVGWDDAKAAANERKHGVTFELASSAFYDPRLPAIRGGFMKDQPLDDSDMPAEIDFSKGIRGLHHIPPGEASICPSL